MNYIANSFEPIIVSMGPEMKSLTIHGIDEVLDRKLKVLSRKENLSLNRTIKKILSDSFGISGKVKRPDHSDDFAEFLGKWKENEADEMRKSLEFSRSVNMEDWK